MEAHRLEIEILFFYILRQIHQTILVNILGFEVSKLYTANTNCNRMKKHSLTGLDKVNVECKVTLQNPE